MSTAITWNLRISKLSYCWSWAAIWDTLSAFAQGWEPSDSSLLALWLVLGGPAVDTGPRKKCYSQSPLRGHFQTWSIPRWQSGIPAWECRDAMRMQYLFHILPPLVVCQTATTTPFTLQGEGLWQDYDLNQKALNTWSPSGGATLGDSENMKEVAPVWRRWHTMGGVLRIQYVWKLPVSHTLPTVIDPADFCHAFLPPWCPSLWSQCSWTGTSELWAKVNFPSAKFCLLGILVTGLQRLLKQAGRLGEIMLMLGDKILPPKTAESSWKCTFSASLG